jgi:hypothetical protein
LHGEVSRLLERLDVKAQGAWMPACNAQKPDLPVVSLNARDGQIGNDGHNM